MREVLPAVLALCQSLSLSLSRCWGGGVTPLSCFDTSCDGYAYFPPVEWTKPLTPAAAFALQTKSLTPTAAFALQMKSQIQRMTLTLYIFPLGHSFQAIGLGKKKSPTQTGRGRDREGGCNKQSRCLLLTQIQLCRDFAEEMFQIFVLPLSIAHNNCNGSFRGTFAVDVYRFLSDTEQLCLTVFPNRPMSAKLNTPASVNVVDKPAHPTLLTQ